MSSGPVGEPGEEGRSSQENGGEIACEGERFLSFKTICIGGAESGRSARVSADDVVESEFGGRF